MMFRWGLNLCKNNTIIEIEHHFDKIIQSCNTLPSLTQIHSVIITTGIITQSVHLTARLIIKYSNFMHIQTSTSIFNTTNHKPSSFLCNTILRAYTNSGFCSEALELYSFMRKTDMLPNNYTFPFVLKSCATKLLPGYGRMVHSEIIRTGFGSDVYVEAALVDMYAGCGIIDDARKVFDKMSRRDVVCWTAMITAYEQAEMGETALGLVCEMQQEGFEMDWVAIVTVASAVGQLGDVRRGRAVHGYAVRNLLFCEVAVVNSVMGMYGKCGEVGVAEMIFERAEERNVITWNSMLTCFVQNGLASEALALFERMKMSDVDINHVTALIVVSACSYLGSRQHALKIHDFIVQKKIDLNQTLWNAIMDMYAKCANLDTALRMFKEIPVSQLDVSSWNTLITGYGMHGYGKEALQLFNQMKDENFQPNHITFTSVLSACSHAGLVNEGKKCFGEMDIFSVIKEPKHYACMVDMLGRAGLLDEAYALIKDMKSQANDEVWGALLLACKIHGNTNLAEVAADNLFQLEPQHTGYYVLMSNIYADSRNWQEVGNLRMNMKNKGLKKPAAVSLIEVNNELHGFRTGEQMDSFTRNIYQKVEKMVIDLKMEGYVPDLSCVFHDVEDEDKHGMLSYHGEKLALAFGLMNIDAGLPIFINKNLRVCSDCHSVFKLISQVYGRKIIVRDVNRFHHFEDGSCSCKDYW